VGQRNTHISSGCIHHPNGKWLKLVKEAHTNNAIISRQIQHAERDATGKPWRKARIGKDSPNSSGPGTISCANR
jgi:2,4-dienoyl-CoA reductase-like NADH-dependent reductase (Old Yellow Enzyme family)